MSEPTDHERALALEMEDYGIKEIAVALRMHLDQFFPSDIFTGQSGDPGPKATLLWRNGCDLILRPPRGVSNVPNTHLCPFTGRREQTTYENCLHCKRIAR